QKDGFIASAPTDIEPIVLRPVIHGLHAVGTEETPRLGNKIGAAATPGIELTVDRTAGFDIREEGFKVYVPSGYTDDKPHGLLVFIAGTLDPTVPNSWFQIFDQRQIIWIAPFNVGNQQTTSRRIGLALEARKYALLNYNIDPQRIYISGISGGGIACSTLIARFPEAFNGSIQIVGASGFGRSRRDYKPGLVTSDTESSSLASGLYMSGRHNLISDRVIRRLRAKNRFVLITGPNDFFYQMIRKAYLSMGYLGFETLLIDVPGLGHVFPREIGPIVRAFEYLDSLQTENVNQAEQ
ncbi:hypothetical protein IH992_35350, partial [Candidatus Poribacteria bacterium]|nr:hypothetical protein [Candidatus Poribacteria bacterium]